jgi:hypothetical protein
MFEKYCLTPTVTWRKLAMTPARVLLVAALVAPFAHLTAAPKTDPVKPKTVAGPVQPKSTVATSKPKEPKAQPRKLVLQIDRITCIKPTKGIGEGRNEIEMSAILVKPPSSVNSARIWSVGKFDKKDSKSFQYELASFNLSTTIKSPLTFRVMLLMADRDNGGFSKYVKRLRNDMQDTLNGVVAKSKKKNNLIADAAEMAADKIGQGWAVDIAKRIVDLWNRNQSDEMLTPSPFQMQTVDADLRVDKTRRTIDLKGYGGHFQVTYSWRLI